MDDFYARLIELFRKTPDLIKIIGFIVLMYSIHW